jgi:hypothetical protein
MMIASSECFVACLPGLSAVVYSVLAIIGVARLSQALPTIAEIMLVTAIGEL